MEKLSLNSSQFELLHQLAQQYSNIVLIYDPDGHFGFNIYECNEFDSCNYPSSGKHEHIIFNYRDITKLIGDNTIYTHNEQALKTVMTQIELTSQTLNKQRKFHRDFRWIKF